MRGKEKQPSKSGFHKFEVVAGDVVNDAIEATATVNPIDAFLTIVTGMTIVPGIEQRIRWSKKSAEPNTPKLVTEGLRRSPKKIVDLYIASQTKLLDWRARRARGKAQFAYSSVRFYDPIAAVVATAGNAAREIMFTSASAQQLHTNLINHTALIAVYAGVVALSHKLHGDAQTAKANKLSQRADNLDSAVRRAINSGR